MRRLLFACAALLALLGVGGVACSSDDDDDDDDATTIDLVAELDDRGRLRGWAGDLVSGELPSVAAERAEAVGHAISSAVGDLDADDLDAVDARARLRLVGQVLGATSAVLAGVADDGGDTDRQATLEYALVLAAEASGGLGLEVEDRLDWIAPASLDASIRDQIRAAVDGRDFREVSRTLVDETDLTGADVVEEVIGELSGVVTVEPGADLLTTFLQAADRGRTSA